MNNDTNAKRTPERFHIRVTSVSGDHAQRCCPTCEEWAYQGKGEGREHGYALRP